VNIPVYSLDDLIDKYGPFEVLKMDCEGCEYDAVLNSNRITEFEEI
jgi:FkbM family methyltransferase